MDIANTRRRRNRAPAACYQATSPYSPAHSLAVRYIMDRYDVSPSLAHTIAALARLGGRA